MVLLLAGMGREGLVVAGSSSPVVVELGGGVFPSWATDVKKMIASGEASSTAEVGMFGCCTFN